VIRYFKKRYKELDFNDKAILLFTLIIIVFVSIFIPIRWVQGEISLVITNTIIVLMATTINLLLVFGYYTEFSRKFFIAAMFAVMALIIQQNGAKQLNWVYPGTAILFFLMPPKVALKTTSSLVIIIAFILWDELPLSRWLQDMLSLQCTILVVFIFCTKVEQQVSLLKSNVKKHQSESLMDRLSGLANRRSFDYEINRINTLKNKDYYLLIIDVDHFKQINDVYGHDVGDGVIKHLSNLLKSNLRNDEQVYRIGGEEFAVIIEGKEQQGNAEHCAERLRQLIEKSKYITKDQQAIRYTISVGISFYADDLSVWFQQADKALYHAKANGRNKIHMAEL